MLHVGPSLVTCGQMYQHSCCQVLSAQLLPPLLIATFIATCCIYFHPPLHLLHSSLHCSNLQFQLNGGGTWQLSSAGQVSGASALPRPCWGWLSWGLPSISCQAWSMLQYLGALGFGHAGTIGIKVMYLV